MHSLTIDVEDYFSLVSRDRLGIEVSVSPRVDLETRRVLDWIDEMGVEATCFVVGKVAEERPHLVREIASRGHEIASHSHAHLLMWQHSPESFRDDLRASIEVLEGITGSAIRGFRAPAFSLGPGQLWAFPIMAEEGIAYDSSVRYAWPYGAGPARVLMKAAAAAGIREHPGFALGWEGLNVPLGGGGGLRLIPRSVTEWGMTRVEGDGFRVPIYVHPYDLAVSEAKRDWPEAPISKRIRMTLFHWLQRRGRGRVAPQVERLVTRSSGAPPMHARKGVG